MSVSSLLSPNNLNLFCATLNGEVPGSNNIPSTEGKAQGLVLAIENPTTGELIWKPDAQASIPDPLVLTGTNSVNKFQVQDVSSNPKFTVDTTNDQTQLTALNNRVEGNDDDKKFGVYSSGDGVNGIIEVSTSNTATGLTVQGQNASHKFRVKDSTGVEIFNVDTLNNGITEFKNPSNNTKLRIETVDGKLEMYNSNAFDTRLSLFNDNVGLNSYSISTQPDGATTTIFAQDTINTVTNNFNLTSAFTQGGTDSKDKFQVKNNAGTDILKVGTYGEGVVQVRGPDSQGKFLVSNATDTAIMQVNTTDRKLIVGTTDKEATINSNVTPEILPVVGIPSSVNMKVEQPLASTDFVGYMARNGNSYMFNLVNDAQTGLFLVASNAAGIQTTAPVLSINSSTAGSQCVLDFKDNISLRGPQSNRIDVGATNQVTIRAQDNLVLDSIDGVIYCQNTVEHAFYPVKVGTINLPTQDNELTPKLYVDTVVGRIYAGTSFSNLVSGTGSISGSLLPNSGVGSLTVPAGTFKPGDSYHVVMAGRCDFSGGDTLTVNLNCTSGNIGTVVVETELTSGSQPFEIEIDFSFHVGGVSAVLITSFDFTYIGTNQGTFVGSRSCAQHSLNATIQQTLSVNASFNAGTNSIQVYSMYIKRMT